MPITGRHTVVYRSSRWLFTVYYYTPRLLGYCRRSVLPCAFPGPYDCYLVVPFLLPHRPCGGYPPFVVTYILRFPFTDSTFYPTFPLPCPCTHVIYTAPHAHTFWPYTLTGLHTAYAIWFFLPYPLRFLRLLPTLDAVVWLPTIVATFPFPCGCACCYLRFG